METKVKALFASYCCNEHPKEITKKQQDILYAALELFSEKGYENTTTLQIAQKACTSEKTLFKYFPTKQILFDHIFYNCLLEATETTFPPEALPLYESLFHFYQVKTNLCTTNPEFFKLIMHRFFGDEEFRHLICTFWQSAYSELLLLEVPTTDALKATYGEQIYDSLTRIIFSLLLGYCVQKTLLPSEKPCDDTKEIQLMLDILFNGLSKLKHPSR